MQPSLDWDKIKNLPTLIPKADSKTVQLDFLGVDMVFFSLSPDFKLVSLSYFK